MPSDSVEQPLSARSERTAAAPRERSTDFIHRPFCAFRLAVAHWPQLGQRLEALLHPLVVDTLRGARRVGLVQLDGLLLEREGLLLEQHVVLLALELGELLRPLRL